MLSDYFQDKSKNLPWESRKVAEKENLREFYMSYNLKQ